MTAPTADRPICGVCEELVAEHGATACRPCFVYGPRAPIAESVWLNGYAPSTTADPCAAPEGCTRGVDRYTADGLGLCRWHAEN